MTYKVESVKPNQVGVFFAKITQEDTNESYILKADGEGNSFCGKSLVEGDTIAPICTQEGRVYTVVKWLEGTLVGTKEEDSTKVQVEDKTSVTTPAKATEVSSQKAKKNFATMKLFGDITSVEEAPNGHFLAKLIDGNNGQEYGLISDDTTNSFAGQELVVGMKLALKYNDKDYKVKEITKIYIDPRVQDERVFKMSVGNAVNVATLISSDKTQENIFEVAKEVYKIASYCRETLIKAYPDMEEDIGFKVGDALKNCAYIGSSLNSLEDDVIKWVVNHINLEKVIKGLRGEEGKEIKENKPSVGDKKSEEKKPAKKGRPKKEVKEDKESAEEASDISVDDILGEAFPI